MSGTIAVLLVSIVVFLVARSLVLWYWKVNTIVTRLDIIAEHLSYLAKMAKIDADRASNAARDIA